MDAIIICRSAREPLRFGSETGYRCETCGELLQVTEPGRKQIAAGGIPLCNRCGLALAEESERRNNIAGTLLNPAAEDQMRKGRGAPALRDLIERQRSKTS